MRFEDQHYTQVKMVTLFMLLHTGISRWKDMKQINDAGHRAAKRYDRLVIGISIGESREVLQE